MLESAVSGNKKEEIRQFLQRFFRRRELAYDENLTELGFMNSLVLLQMLKFIEKQYGVLIQLDEDSLKEMDSIDSIAELVASMQGQSEGTPPLFRLRNGKSIDYLDQAETMYFYQDIFEKKSYFRNGIQLNRDAVVFDVGSNIGLFSLYILEHYSDSKVYGFEPVLPTYAVLKNNLEVYHRRVTLFPFGLSNESKECDIAFYPNNPGMSSIYANQEEERTVITHILRNQGIHDQQLLHSAVQERLKQEIYKCSLRTLSTVFREYGIEHVDLLKIDVQKSELDVLRGIADDHWPKIRQIVLEVHDLDGRLDRIRDLLRERNYRIVTEQDENYKGTVMYNLYAILQ